MSMHAGRTASTGGVGGKVSGFEQWIRRRVVRRTLVSVYVLALVAVFWFWSGDSKVQAVVIATAMFGAFIPTLIVSFLWRTNVLWKTAIGHPHALQEQFDERQKLVRQKALADAYLCIAVGMACLWVWSVLRGLNGTHYTHDEVIRLLLGCLVVIATLPNVLIVWREPDCIQPDKLISGGLQ